MKEDQVINGIIASKGLVSGKVRIITDPKQVDEFLEGEVLVSEFTNPSYVKAMVKAVAIVTNFGGVNCHAAIIAREFGLPCIVGTKNATKILKDGDLIEVDANLGIVKILKS